MNQHQQYQRNGSYAAIYYKFSKAEHLPHDETLWNELRGTIRRNIFNVNLYKASIWLIILLYIRTNTL